MFFVEYFEYEYDVEYRHEVSFNDIIKKRGKDGWELISVTNENYGGSFGTSPIFHTYFWWKRKKVDSIREDE